MARIEVVVVGVSAGATKTLTDLLSRLPLFLPVPMVIVQHLHPWQTNVWVKEYDLICPLIVKEAGDRERLQENMIYFAPPNYHLMINDDKTFVLSIDHKVNFSRPSIDVLFESAVDVYREKVAGVILTGASHDGAAGLKRIHLAGGVTLVQEPKTAVVSFMPQSALEAVPEALILPIPDMGLQLFQWARISPNP